MRLLRRLDRDHGNGKPDHACRTACPACKWMAVSWRWDDTPLRRHLRSLVASISPKPQGCAAPVRCCCEPNAIYPFTASDGPLSCSPIERVQFVGRIHVAFERRQNQAFCILLFMAKKSGRKVPQSNWVTTQIFGEANKTFLTLIENKTISVEHPFQAPTDSVVCPEQANRTDEILQHAHLLVNGKENSHSSTTD